MDLLDLDSFLQANSSDDDDDETATSHHRRTVDEILNESSSSNPFCPKSQALPQQDQTTLMKQQQAPISSSSLRRRTRSPLSLPTFSPSLPPLFGAALCPNPKPGAALAAAAAASRFVQSPHAAAIKSRRSSGAESSTYSNVTVCESCLIREDAYSESCPIREDAEMVGQSLEAKQENLIESIAIDIVVAGESSARKVDEKMPHRDDHDDLEEAKMEDLIESTAIASVVDDESAPNVDDRMPQSDDDDDDGDNDLEEAEAGNGNDNKVDDALLLKIEESNPKATQDDQITGKGEIVESGTDVDELRELESSKKEAEKKLRSSMKHLEWAEELEKRHASSGLDWEQGAAARLMRLEESIRRDPPAVGFLQTDVDNAITRAISSQTFRRDHGTPQVVAVHMNFIAVGTLRGTVLVAPSKYSPYSTDNMDAKMLTFESHGEKSQAPVTSMCFNQQGDLLLVGYGDGHLTVWDVQKAVATKVISGVHSAPVIHALFLGQESQVTRQFQAITGDCKGVVLIHTSSVVPFLNLFSIKTKCLLDGQKLSTVLSVSSLLMDASPGVDSASVQGNSTISTSALGSLVGSVVGGETGLKLFSEGSSLAEGVVILVTNQKALVVRLSPNPKVYKEFPRPDGVREGSTPYTAWKCSTSSSDPSVDASDKISWLAIAWDWRVQVAKLVKSEMKLFKEWNLDSAAIGVAWLDDQMLAVLTLGGQLCLFAKNGNELNRTSYVIDGSGIDDIIGYHTQFSNAFGNPEKAYHNSVAIRGATIYILGPMHLITSRLLPWKERIQVLQRAGDWMGALDMAMRVYDGHVHGVIDLPRTVDATRDTIMPYLVELLLTYVDEVFSYTSVAFSNQIEKMGEAEDPKAAKSSLWSEIEEQYAHVGGIAVEYCVHIKRIDILFDGIFSRFVAVQHGGTFLEILEPYILRDLLGCLPPEIMQALVQHYSSKGWLQRVELCILHMDISSVDFNQVVKLCREHGLYDALIYLFNQGLDDFKAPLEELLVVVQDSLERDVSTLGYRMLVYLKYCFQGLAFPPGHGNFPPSRLWSVRKELLEFLLEESKSLTSQVLQSFKSSCGTCPNLCYLLWLDTESTLEVLKCAFLNEDDLQCLENQNPTVQRMTDTLISVLDLDFDEIRYFVVDGILEVWPPKEDLVRLLEFIAFLVSCKGATISGRVLRHILEYLTSHELAIGSPNQKMKAHMREKQVLTLLKVVPRTDWFVSYMLHLCTEAQFYKACGLLHTIGGQFITALDCYMKDSDKSFHAFAFIHKMLLQLKNSEASTFRSAVISRIPELIKLSREFAYLLVIEHFSSERQQIILDLRSQQESHFLFLKTAFEVHLLGTLNIPVLQAVYSPDQYKGMRDTSDELEDYLEKISDFPKLLHINAIHVTDEIAKRYLPLLCQYECKSVLKFLKTFENYQLDYCLAICKKYDVADAVAFLSEKVGDVGIALVYVMAGLKEKIDLLVASVENTFSETTLSNFTLMEQLNEILKLNEVVSVHDVLQDSIELCQRNTRCLNPDESESLWFQLLNSFLDSVRFSYPHKSSKTLWRVFTQFTGEVIEGMAGYVPLPEIMSKLLSHNRNQEFGDFKLTILRMLGTYEFERRILGTAKCLIEEDTFYTMCMLKKGASHAYTPHEFVCCICSSSLTKESSSSGIRVFSCGHATHLHCESGECEPSSKDSEVGCPICLPKNNPRAKFKSVLVDNQLVKNSTPSFQPTQGFHTAHHLPGPDAEEKSYGFQQMSRFEMLSNLQKARLSLQVYSLPQLILTPPALYHEKVLKGCGSLMGEASSNSNNKPNKRCQLRELKSRGLGNPFPLKSSIFGPQKNKVC